MKPKASLQSSHFMVVFMPSPLPPWLLFHLQRKQSTLLSIQSGEYIPSTFQQRGRGVCLVTSLVGSGGKKDWVLHVYMDCSESQHHLMSWMKMVVVDAPPDHPSQHQSKTFAARMFYLDNNYLGWSINKNVKASLYYTGTVAWVSNSVCQKSSCDSYIPILTYPFRCHKVAPSSSFPPISKNISFRMASSVILCLFPGFLWCTQENTWWCFFKSTYAS